MRSGSTGFNTLELRKNTINFLVKYGVIISIIFIIAIFSILNNNFLNINNILNILYSASFLAIISLGITFSVAVDGFDVSVGANAGFAVIICAVLLIYYNVPWYLAILVPMLVGALIGYLNSILINKLRIPDMLAALGMMFILQGVQITLIGGENLTPQSVSPTVKSQIFEIPEQYLFISRGKIFQAGNFDGIALPVIIMIFMTILAYIILERTPLGRSMYAIGGNTEAARLSGIRINTTRSLAYIISGILAAVGGILIGSRVGSGLINAGTPYLLEGVAATFFGFSFLGLKRPNVFGTVVGAIFIALLSNGLQMVSVPWFLLTMFKGIILIFALSLGYGLVKRK